MTGRKRWMAAIVAETKKEAPVLPFTRQQRGAKREEVRIAAKKAAA